MELPDAVTEVPEAGPTVLARLIKYEHERHIALPPHTTYALIEHPEVRKVPGAAHYAHGMLNWEGMLLPLIDLDILLHSGSIAARQAPPRYALIVAYQRIAPGPLEYGAIGLAELPLTIAVGDEAQCELPKDSALWPRLALSCFRHEGSSVPIIDTSRLFGSCHRMQVESQEEPPRTASL